MTPSPGAKFSHVSASIVPCSGELRSLGNLSQQAAERRIQPTVANRVWTVDCLAEGDALATWILLSKAADQAGSIAHAFPSTLFGVGLEFLPRSRAVP